MAAFNYSSNGDYNYPDASTPNDAYNLMSGIRVNGTSHYNPFGGYTTKFIYSGNPVAGTGWNQPLESDVRFYVSTGPVNMNPGDTQTIVTAQIIARGTSYLNSITILKQYADIVKQYYQSCYTSIPIGIQELSETANKFMLYQNYPNPFNPETKIKFEIPNSKFETNPKTEIRIYDILGREIKTLVNEQLKPGIYEVEFDGTNLPSGVYFYKLVSGDFTQSKKMVLIK
jgi:hypothetical protein